MMSMDLTQEIIDRLPTWKEHFGKLVKIFPEYALEGIEGYVDSIENDPMSVDCWYLEVRTDINMMEQDGLIDETIANDLRDFFLRV